MPRLPHLLLAVFGLGASVPAARSGSVPAEGPAIHPRVYDLQVEIPDKAFTGTLAVDVDALPPTVTLQAGGQEARILSVKGTADSLDLVTSQGADLFSYHLLLEDEKIRGTVLFNGGELKGTVTGQRQR